MQRLPARRCCGPAQQCAQRGVALALVLWFVAAMSVLVGAMVMQARTDAQLAQVHINEARAAAAGDGAIRLLLAQRHGAVAATLPSWGGSYRVGNLAVSVAALPARLLVDANRASAPLLARVLTLAGATPAPQALANAIVQWRPPAPFPGQPRRRFATLEDLLQVEGFSRTSWEAVRDYLSARREVSALVDDDRRARRLLGLLQAMAPVARARQSQLLPALADDAVPGGRREVLRVDALLRLDGRLWLRRCWVDSGTAGPDLPWEALRREPVRVIAVGG